MNTSHGAMAGKYKTKLLFFFLYFVFYFLKKIIFFYSCSQSVFEIVVKKQGIKASIKASSLFLFGFLASKLG